MITTAPEGRVLLHLSWPMALSMAGVIGFNLVDTFFVASLGSQPLAALTFTFPVILVVGSLAHGLGTGLTAAVSRAAGAGNEKFLGTTVFWGMVLALGMVVLAVVPGFLTISPLFTLLGADGHPLELIRAYMTIWYPGVLFLIIPMAGNAVIIGMGDTKTPAHIMLTAIFANIILDPVLIFGLGPVPGLGVAGAALATIIARSLTLFWVLYLLIVKTRVLRLASGSLKQVAKIWREILMVGLPNVLTRLILPVASGILTAMVAAYGSRAVAGLGIAVRLEMFATLAMTALVSALPVFIGQNHGAKRMDRVERGLGLGAAFCLGYGAIAYPLLLVLSPGIIRWINTDPGVVSCALAYLRIVPIAYGMQGIMQISATSLNLLKKPVQSAAISLVQVFGFFLPLALLGSTAFGLAGIYGGLALSYLVAGLIGRRLNGMQLRALSG